VGLVLAVLAMLLGCAGTARPPSERDKVIEEFIAIQKEAASKIGQMKDGASVEKLIPEIEPLTRRVEELTRRKAELGLASLGDQEKETRHYHDMGAAGQEVSRAWKGLDGRLARREVPLEMAQRIGDALGRFRDAVTKFRQVR
jgi:hypothetical protein